MKKINKTRYAILGILFDRSMSGYEIKQFMLESTANFWKESDASIYPMLKILEVEGLVISRVESKGKRDRNVLEITDAGKKEFLDWMQLAPENGNRRSEFLLKLFFGGSVSVERVLQMLYLRLDSVNVQLDKFRNIEKNVLVNIPNKEKNKIFWNITLRNGLLACEAELKWINESIKSLKRFSRSEERSKEKGVGVKSKKIVF